MIESPRRLLLLSCLLGAVMAPAQLMAQPAGCTLAPDERNPSEKILRCGDSLTIRNTPNTRYHVLGETHPSGAQLDSGALMIEFTPTERQKDFQIMTPQAIAAVRGTRWVVDVGAKQSSTLVLAGTVEVRRPGAAKGALLGAGEGADVAAGNRPVVKKRWGKKRVDALLARFGN